MEQMDTPQIGEIEVAQSERTERARAALLSGRFQVTRIGPQRWSVKNGDKLPYAVALNEGAWTCTCMDFQQEGPQVRCKHIEGVRLSEEASALSNQTIHKEMNMDQIHNQIPDGLSRQVDRILAELRQPLDMSRVKRRQAPGSGSVPYLEGYDVIERANTIFGFAWSFEVLHDPAIVRWQKKVLAWNQQEKRKVPVTDANGNVQCEEVGIVYITGKVSVDLGGTFYTHADLGRCIFTGDTPEALDMALAGSVTDCLKRCFRQMGEQFGNLLYDKDIAQNAGLDQGAGQSVGNSHSASPTNKPAAATTASSSQSIRKYGDGTNVNGNVSEQEAFDQYKKSTGAAPASKDVLRSWMNSQRKPVPSVAA
jgi:DNA repair and recombination protein RAD52